MGALKKVSFTTVIPFVCTQPCNFIKLIFLTSVDVIRDKETGRSRGFGFVKYCNAEDAKDAMTAMDGKVVTEPL